MAFTVGKVADFMSNGRLTSATYYDKDGVLRVSPAGGIRMDHDQATKAARGVLIESSRTNKCINHNANPTDLTNVFMFGEPSTTLTLVNDAAALGAAGLGGVCSSGMVFKLDNSLGVSFASAVVSGPQGNDNVHASSAFVRGGAGALQASSGDGFSPFAASPTYRRLSTTFSHASDMTLRFAIRADAGQVVYFILNQLEEGDFATSPIITQGTQVTRGADALSIIDADTKDWFNPAAWTFFVEFDPGVLGDTKNLMSSDHGAYLRLRGDGRPVVGFNDFDLALALSALSASGPTKFAGSYADEEYAASLNGGDAVVVSASPPATSSLIADSGASGELNGHITRMGYFPRRLSDLELKNLTT